MIDSYANTSMALIRYINYNFKFNSLELNKIIKFIIENFDYSWSYLYNNKRLEKLFKIKLFQPMDHNLYFKEEGNKPTKEIYKDKMIDKLYNKLLKLRIEKDMEDKYF